LGPASWAGGNTRADPAAPRGQQGASGTHLLLCPQPGQLGVGGWPPQGGPDSTSGEWVEVALL